jgi:hypothetical protein
MKILIFMAAILGSVWLFSNIATIKANEAYRKGYRDGFNALAVDSQCASWLMNSNIKEAKERICK